MAATYLDEILVRHRERANADVRDWRQRLADVHYDGPSMIDALSAHRDGHVTVIAEVKRRSPSKGWLNEFLRAADLAHSYVEGGASAISVLTDVESFAGSVHDLVDVAAVVDVPILRKDFTVSANDVLDGASLGAGAVLLIVAALSNEELQEFLVVAEACGVEALVEVHDAEEARRAVDAGARIVGVNQRNLHTFDVDPARAASVVGVLPSSLVTVCESGLAAVSDVRRAADAGFDAVLVGEVFVTSSAVREVVHSFASVPWVGRG